MNPKIDDLHSTTAYRRKLVRGLLIRNLWPYLESGFVKS